MSRLLLAATWFLTAVSATITVSPNVTAACADITAGNINTDSLPAAALDPDYVDAKTHYWSLANGDLSPQCVAYPTSAKQVSQIVTILNRYEDVQFAVKSGGHNPNVGWSSVDGGVLISMKNLSSTVYDAAESTADIGPGARWVDVISTLQPYNVAVVSGRLGKSLLNNETTMLTAIGDVGVAGLSLGGGLSFLSGQYGLVCDNVVNFEVVQADGSIVNVNANSNPDQFFALKGGGNQFGTFPPPLPTINPH
jgi:FAD/FMN-containing dehydrogenase